MSDPVIQVRHLSKRYQIGHRQAAYRTLRETLSGSFRRSFGRLSKILTRRPLSSGLINDTIWALKDVSFKVNRGEVIGVIGRNGAGKSTLLKILSRITEPTVGHVEINGRVGSLLEVGTGFHEELTGRENVYLNAAILGMKKLETKRRFDEIVSFAEIEKFIDTPVKHYSSGMHVRLAFAVAAHLDPEILLVDEVLAVGDLGFQQRAIERMSFLMTQGITVIFVSHNLPMVRRFCKWGFLLENGAIKASGEIEHVINTYKRVFVENVQAHTAQQGLVKVQTVRLLDAHNRIPQAEFDCGGEMLVEIVLSSSELLRGVHFHIAFRSTELNRYCVASTAFDSITIGEIKGSITIEARVKGLNFPPGIYQTEVFISNLSHTYDYASYKTEPFEILPRPGVDERLGAYLIPAKWEVKRG